MEYEGYTLYADPRQEGFIEIIFSKRKLMKKLLRKKEIEIMSNIQLVALNYRIAGKKI